MSKHTPTTIHEDHDDDESSSSYHHSLGFMPKRPVQKNKKTVIKHLVIMGDSLSDRGFMDSLKLGGLLPMDIFSGLKGVSPDKRFTNGYVWVDELVSLLATDFKIARIRRMARQSDKQYLNQDDADRPRYDDIYDGLLANDHKLKAAIGEDASDCTAHAARLRPSLSDSNIRDGHIINREPGEPVHTEDFELDNYLAVTYHGKTWLRSFCQGGLTAYDYSWHLSTSIVRFFTRAILSTLDDMRHMVLNNDRNRGITWRDKQETMVVEWTGANDMVTVNREPSIAIANRTIAARMNNMRKMIHAGYRNFALINLPDLSLTPRYQALSHEEQANASRCCDHFNEQLAIACANMAREFPECQINVFDINSPFKDMFNNPEQYSFDRDKLTTPFTSSKDFCVGSCLVSRRRLPDDIASLNLPQGYQSWFIRIRGDNNALYYIDRTDNRIQRLPVPENNRSELRHALRHIDKNSLMSTENYQKLLHLTNFTPLEDGSASPSRGYMFWNDVHPSADTHALNGRNFYEWLTSRYQCVEPDSQLCNLKKETAESILCSFRKSYRARLAHDRSRLFGCLSSSRFDYQHASLADVFYHALYSRGSRTKEVLRKLGLLDKNNQPVLDIPAVAEAMNEIAAEQSAPVYTSSVRSEMMP